MKKEKKYLIDKNNNLNLQASKSKELTPLKGKFLINKDNTLEFKLNERNSWRLRQDLPKKVSFKGQWKLNKNYDLVLDVEEDKNKPYSLVFKGKILSVNSDSLFFKLKQTKLSFYKEKYQLELKGIWNSDKFNRLIFQVRRNSHENKITLKSAWVVNKNQQIVYKYTKTKLKTKEKVSESITFDGIWRIKQSNKLSFILSRSSSSQFNFRAQVESLNLYPQKDKIKYRLGIGYGKYRKEKIITLYGDWKFSKKLGISYEMKYLRGHIESIKFQSKIHLNKKDSVVIALRTSDNKPLGINFKFKRAKLPKKLWEYFLHLKKQGQASSVGLGATIRF